MQAGSTFGAGPSSMSQSGSCDFSPTVEFLAPEVGLNAADRHLAAGRPNEDDLPPWEETHRDTYFGTAATIMVSTQAKKRSGGGDAACLIYVLLRSVLCRARVDLFSAPVDTLINENNRGVRV